MRQFPAHVADVHVEGPIGRRGLALVDGLADLVARDHASCAARQKIQNVELDRRQVNRLASHRDSAAFRVDR